MKEITVEILSKMCLEQVKKGNGKKVVLISTDDEGNGYHTLYFGFRTKESDIRMSAAMGMFHDNNAPEKVVLLG